MSFMLLGILNSQAAGGGAGAYDLLETQTLTSDASSVTFTGLSSYSDYKHLQIRCSVRVAGNDGIAMMRLNNDSTSSYGSSGMTAYNGLIRVDNDTNASSMRLGRVYERGDHTPSQSYGASIIDILDFASANKKTTVMQLGGRVPSELDKRVDFGAGVFDKTNAVTSLSIFDIGSDLKANSRFSLYGIKG